jgi:hypothetical protein
MGEVLNLRIDPEWEEIETVRQACSDFLAAKEFSNEAVHALTMVVSELTENGIKYGSFKEKKKKILIDIYVGHDMVTIEVNNPVSDEAYTHLKRLDTIIQGIRGYQDPFEAYIEKMKDVSKKAFRDQESGLGLARIAYEGRAVLDFFINNDDRLCVSTVSYRTPEKKYSPENKETDRRETDRRKGNDRRGHDRREK